MFDSDCIGGKKSSAAAVMPGAGRRDSEGQARWNDGQTTNPVRRAPRSVAHDQRGMSDENPRQARRMHTLYLGCDIPTSH
jgi:hypothetical protein